MKHLSIAACLMMTLSSSVAACAADKPMGQAPYGHGDQANLRTEWSASRCRWEPSGLETLLSCMWPWFTLKAPRTKPE